ncbi:response regulator transcription factor [Chryseobacterium sp.]|uniref:response regulator transcription factor n=1 Tax=Chryseobacterium sp. TaxID=1871047 RepID=UPI0011CCDE23|nr:response regulator [Chryseobacterium sp.]TXF79561.1 response regulator [Chryseobacterium sp.]
MKKILLIEENKVVSSSLKFLLDNSGYTIKTAKDGKEGLRILSDDYFDLTIIELKLPVINGTMLISMISESPFLKKRANKIFVMTSNSTEEMLEQMFEMGADDYLKKPFSATEFLMRTKKLLN